MDFLGLCRAQNAVDATRALGGADGASPIYRVSLPEFAEAGVAMVPGGGKWMFHGCVFLETCFLDIFLWISMDLFSWCFSVSCFFWDQIYMLKTEKLRNHGMVDVFSWTEADGT
jgi:hypothetical protein